MGLWIFLSLKNLLVPIYTKLHLKSCNYLFIYVHIGCNLDIWRWFTLFTTRSDHHEFHHIFFSGPEVNNYWGDIWIWISEFSLGESPTYKTATNLVAINNELGVLAHPTGHPKLITHQCLWCNSALFKFTFQCLHSYLLQPVNLGCNKEEWILFSAEFLVFMQVTSVQVFASLLQQETMKTTTQGY